MISRRRAIGGPGPGDPVSGEPTHRDGDIAGSAESEVLRLLEDYLRRLESGVPPDPEEVIARHPRHAEALREHLKSLDFLHQAAAGFQGEARVGEVTADGAATSIGETISAGGGAGNLLGDYRILREVGRGGMGVVYEAEQVSLGRRVALKVLPFAAVLDPRQIQRFRNEAQAAASLHHTNIVPVFSVGCERGVHYYAMQFIEGQNLARVVSELRQLRGRDPAGSPESPSPSASPSPATLALAGPSDGTQAGRLHRPARESFRAIARLGLQAGEALEHAHRHEVIHRDIKPSNLLLDGAGTLWITDFGLARLGAEGSLTRSGSVLGTLRYMSPEQARARRGAVDGRSDVYSLGATLYELLTLEPVLDGEDREELLRRIALDDPRLPRAIDRSIPEELETIVLKALAKEPDSRYGSAEEMAEDLRRFLQDQPIKARRPGLLERARKWTRRHRAMAGAAVAVLIFALAAFATTTFIALHEEGRTRLALRAAEADYRDARDAVERLLSRVAIEKMDPVPQMERVQGDLLLDAVEFYRRLLARKPNDADLAFQAARAMASAAKSQYRLGRNEEASKLLDETIASLRHLANESGLGHSVILVLVSALIGRAEISREDDGNLVKSGRLLEEARSRAAELVRENPGDADAESALGCVLGEASNLACSQGEMAQARQLSEEAVRRLEAALDRRPMDESDRESLSNFLGNLAMLQGSLNEKEKAEETFRKCIETRKKLTNDFADRPGFRWKLGCILYKLGVFYQLSERPVEAEATYREALVHQERVAADFPTVPDYQRDLGCTLNNLAILVGKRGEHAEEISLLERAIVRQRDAIGLHPSDLYARENLCNHLGSLSAAREDTGDLQSAVRITQDLITSRRTLSDARREAQGLLKDLALDWKHLGDLLEKTGTAAQAESAFHEAELILEDLHYRNPRLEGVLEQMALSLAHIGALRSSSKDFDGARNALKKAFAFDLEYLRQSPEDSDRHKNLREDFGHLIMVLGALKDGRAIEARAEDIATQNLEPEDLLLAADALEQAANIAGSSAESDLLHARATELQRKAARQANGSSKHAQNKVKVDMIWRIPPLMNEKVLK